MFFHEQKETLPRVSDDAAEEDTNEEKPLVVVLNPGDLTAEEAESYKRQKQQKGIYIDSCKISFLPNILL